MIRRRLVLACAGSALWTLPGAARAQRHPRIGVIGTGAPEPANPNIQALADGLREQGYVEGRNVVVEYRWGANAADLPALAADLARLKVDVIVSSGYPANKAAKSATATIPIVMATSGDAVQEGLVASLSRPRGQHDRAVGAQP